MQAIIDSKTGEYFKCLLENGDFFNIHENDIEDIVEVGNLVSVKITKSEPKKK